MTAIDNTPTNKNFLSPLNFRFSIKRAPYLNFFVQKVNLPSITLPVYEVYNPLHPLPEPGTTMKYEDLTVTFKVDEDLTNYLEIHNWLRGLGFPDNFTEYSNVSKKVSYSGEGLTSELSLMILDSAKKPNYEIVFRNAFPTYLSELTFDASYQDVEFITASVIFRYIIFDVVKVT